MAIHNKDDDYFIPALGPYVQWVKAYRELISTLYKEHKTVRKAWKAFRDAIPGVERRLEFGIFEQILLFSLFLSEWNSSEKGDVAVEKGGLAKSGTAYGVEDRGDKLDIVIQKLRDASSERDRALWNLKHLEQSVLMLRDQKSDLATQVSSLEKNLETLEIESGATNEQLKRVIHELDSQRVENAGLRGESVVLREKETSLRQQIERLRKKFDRLSTGKAQTQQIVAVKDTDTKEGFSQTVIQWVRQDVRQGVRPEVIQTFQRRTPPKKIGRWNAQRSKDGYYRLYRKIGGRVHSIYVGKELDIDKAESRIADKERKLFTPSPASGGAESTYSKRQMKMEAALRAIEGPTT
ncbi:MAG: hypothetical protein WAN11_11290 [Syntrophobacteraceae bacterium]